MTVPRDSILLLRRTLDRRTSLKLAGVAGALGLSPRSTHARATHRATQADQEPRRGGTLRVALTLEPPTLDLHQTTDIVVLHIMGHVYETLFTWDDRYNVVPLLAESHEVSADGLRITVRLRQGVPFHNGETLQAADVIASVERWGRVVGLGEGLLAVTDEIVEVDPTTVEFRLSRPFGTFPIALARALQGCAIYPKSTLDQSSDTDLAEYIGTGPYRFVEWLPDQHVALERFDDYASLPGPPIGYSGGKGQYLDRLEFLPVRDEASRVAGMQTGDYHYLEIVNPDQSPILSEDPSLTVETLPADAWLNFVLNLESPVFANVDVRRAVQLALDHEPIMQAAVGEGFYELTPTLLPGAPIWESDAGAEFYNQYDPGRASELLQDAGYDGTPLRFMTTQEIPQEYNATVVVKQQLEEAGFLIDLQVFDGATLSDLRNDPTAWELYTATASFRPDPVLRNLTCSASGSWCTAEKDALLADLQSEAEFEARYPIWEAVQQAFYEEVPRLKIGSIRRIHPRNGKLQGIGPTELQPDFSNAWFSED